MAFDVKFSEGSASFKTAFDKYVAGSSGGGGTPSKYAQPDWGAEAPIEILPEATYEIDPEQGMAYILTPFNLEAGQRYVVDLSGMLELECTAVEISDGDTTMTAIGNTGALMGGVNTNEPFVIVQAPEEMAAEGVYGMLVWLGGTASVTLSVTKHGMHKIPAEYVEAAQPPLLVGLVEDGNDLRSDVEYSEIERAIDAGRTVYLIGEDSDSIKSNFVTKNYNGIVFMQAYVTSGYNAITLYNITGPNGYVEKVEGKLSPMS